MVGWGPDPSRPGGPALNGQPSPEGLGWNPHHDQERPGLPWVPKGQPKISLVQIRFEKRLILSNHFPRKANLPLSSRAKPRDVHSADLSWKCLSTGRTWISCLAALDTITHAAFVKESPHEVYQRHQTQQEIRGSAVKSLPRRAVGSAVSLSSHVDSKVLISLRACGIGCSTGCGKTEC